MRGKADCDILVIEEMIWRVGMVKEDMGVQIKKLKAGMRVKDTIIKDLSDENEKLKIIVDSLIDKIKKLQSERDKLREAYRNVAGDLGDRDDDGEEGA